MKRPVTHFTIVLVLGFILVSCSQQEVRPVDAQLETQTFYPNSFNIRMKTADWNKLSYPGEVFNLNTYGSEFPYELNVWVLEPGTSWRNIERQTVSDRAAETARNRTDDFLFVADPYPVVRKGSLFWVSLVSKNDQHTRCMQNNVRRAC